MRSSNTNRGNNSRLASKVILLILAMSLLLGTAIGGTLAWLMAETDPVVNTFTYGDINIDLVETDTEIDEDGNDKTNTYQMFPGEDVTKDPRVILKADSEPCWLFVKLEKSGDFDKYMEYSIQGGELSWAPLEGEDDVYYLLVTDKPTEDMTFQVLTNDRISMKESVTKEDLEALGTNYPTLTITAWAVQYDAGIDAIDTAAEAWALACAENEEE